MNHSIKFMRARSFIPVVFLLLVSSIVVSIAFSSFDDDVSEREMPSPIRAIHFVTLGNSLERMKELVDQAAEHRFNVVVIGLGWRNSMKLSSMPWAAEDAVWDPDTIRALVEYARRKAIEIVPHFPLLTKQEVILGPTFPELLFNERTYDPRKKAVYQIVLPVIDELVQIMDPLAFHIGHDEVWGSRDGRGRPEVVEQMLPADLFFDDVVLLNEQLKLSGVETWMWGDMLLESEEFPDMIPVSLLGDAPGYGKAMRDRLPRDIVIIDWHYRDTDENFDSLSALASEGFKVIGATWKTEKSTRDFASFAAKNGAAGMLATTWFHTRVAGDEKLVQDIVSTSGGAFLASFPDK